MKGLPLDNDNPYESPRDTAKASGSCETPQRTHLWHDVLFIVLSVLCWFIVAGGLGSLSRAYSNPSGIYLLETAPLTCWVRWMCYTTGRAPGDLISGFLLGGFLRRINPWLVFWAMSAFLLLIASIMFVFPRPGAEFYFDTVGMHVAVLHTVLGIAANLGMVALAIVCGQGRLRQIRSRKLAANSEGRKSDRE